ncbi:pentapeptide repeat-containing protein [Myxococcus sp. K15C18031901]|uniref:pentapeptide repeat-containing protein n=1 Tax=Myxococcus dinghuensis TaxID=2906761 RepID=UPI0020A71BAE|nr:pentapeptide repeat-containing protein [Myxococcus dinghuensis]MCP3103395.1 pentapeptide repeat-containing protein [Myxococcus dinghuensis]
MSTDATSEFLRRLREEEAFENETFSDLLLDGADLGGKEFYRCTFRNVQLQSSRWKESQLEDCVFEGCNLTRSNVLALRLRGARFEGSKLMGIDWTGVASNPEMHFEECGLQYDSFVGFSLRKTPFLRCVCKEANFFDMDLTESDFSETDLTGSNFRGCTLTRVTFSGTQGLVLDPARNRLKDTRVPPETAMALAHSLGMLVDGYHAKASTRAAGSKKAR